MAKLTLNPAPGSYTMQDQADTRKRLEDAFRPLFAKDQTNYLGQGKIVLTDETDGSQWQVFVASGALGIRQVS